MTTRAEERRHEAGPSWHRLLVVALLCANAFSCRTIHENIIRQNLTETRLRHSVFHLTLDEVKTRLAIVPKRPNETSSLFLAHEEPTADGHRWCLAEIGAAACFTAHPQPDGLSFTADGPNVSGLVRLFWGLIDPTGSEQSFNASEDDVPQLAQEEEETFERRWSFIVGGRSGAITSATSPVFTFGGQVGVRYWASTYVIPGLAIEVENAVFRSSSVVTLAPQARVELSVWRPENAAFFNLPNISFLMAAEPLIAFGDKTSVGARAVVGVHLMHLGRFPTPFFFEFGFQALTVDKRDAAGLRVAIGIGF